MSNPTISRQSSALATIANLPAAIQNATVKHGLTLHQAEELAYAVELSEMDPPRAMSFLVRYSPEQVTAALVIRGEYCEASIPIIIKAMEVTGYPLDGVPGSADFDAVINVIRERKFKKAASRYVDDPFGGGANRETFYRTVRTKYVSSWGYGNGEGGMDDYDDESFA